MIHTRGNHEGRRNGPLVGLGTVGIGVLMGLLGQVGDAPLAHADDYSAVVADIEGVETLGQADFGDAAAAFGSGDTLQGLADTFAGLDDTTVSPGEWLSLAASDALTGTALPDSGWFNFDDSIITPASWSDAVADASTLASTGNDFLTAASEAVAGGDVSTGLSDFLVASDFLTILDPQELVLGLASMF